MLTEEVTEAGRAAVEPGRQKAIEMSGRWWIVFRASDEDTSRSLREAARPMFTPGDEWDIRDYKSRLAGDYVSPLLARGLRPSGHEQPASGVATGMVLGSQPPTPSGE